MKFTVSSSDFQKALSKLSGVIPTRSSLPILENILFDLKKDALRIVATDLEVSISVSINVKGSGDGSITVPAKRLLETVRSLADVQILFTADLVSNKIKLITETGEYTLIGEASADFPETTEFKGDDGITFEGGVLKKILGRTIFAVSSDELRPAMTGVLFDVAEKELRAVATDGHRLVRLVLRGIGGKKQQNSMIIPSKALHLIIRTAEDTQTTMSMSSSHVQFTFGNTMLTSKLIQEKYPNYESVIPIDNEKTLTVQRETLLNGVRRVSLYSSSTTHQVRFTLKKNDLKIAAEDIDFGGEAREKINCTYEADEMEIGFNSNYIIDVLTHIDGDDVTFKLNRPERAAIVVPTTQKENEELLMIVMPVRLNA